MSLTGLEIRDAFVDMFPASDATSVALVQGYYGQRHIGATFTDGGTAATAADEFVVYRNATGGNVRVVSAYVATPVAVTADASHYKTITLQKRDSAGANNATVAAATTQTAGAGGTGDLTAFAPVALTLTAANVVVAAGGVLTIKAIKTGNGVAIASATAPARIEVILEPV